MREKTSTARKQISSALPASALEEKTKHRGKEEIMRISTLELRLEMSDFSSQPPEDHIWGETSFLRIGNLIFGVVEGRDRRTYLTFQESGNPRGGEWAILDAHLGKVNYTEWAVEEKIKVTIAYERAMVKVIFPV
jgi:hypothetical protein